MSTSLYLSVYFQRTLPKFIVPDLIWDPTIKPNESLQIIQKSALQELDFASSCNFSVLFTLSMCKKNLHLYHLSSHVLREDAR